MPLPARRTASYAPANAAPVKETQETALVPQQTAKTDGARIVAENREDLEDGRTRITRTYEREDGRSLTKIEEFALTERGARKTVVQQNPSGSITRYEEILDREESGTFRRTQRFQDGNGDVATNITTNYQVTDAFVLTGGQSYAGSETLPFAPTRGTQLDLRA